MISFELLLLLLLLLLCVYCLINPDSTAYRDGRINPGDRLVRVDDVSVANEPYHIVNHMVKAKGQTEVTLMFDHCTSQKVIFDCI